MRHARPEAALEDTVCENAALRRGETVVAAVSGGADSAALATLLGRAAERKGATVVLGHVNHALRQSSWQDEAVVLALGSMLRMRVRTIGLGPGSTAEARLRDERYDALATIARDCGARRVFAGHHAQDQTETVLLALFRGVGPAGLGGMARKRALAGGLVLERPLLEIEPERLRTYCERSNIPYALDPSNRDPGYARNAVRLALVDLRARFPHLDAAVARCALILRDEREATPRAQLRERVRSEIVAATGDARDVSFERIDAVARALERGRRGRHFLRRGVEIHVE